MHQFWRPGNIGHLRWILAGYLDVGSRVISGISVIEFKVLVRKYNQPIQHTYHALPRVILLVFRFDPESSKILEYGYK